jgi:hypothetical protein
MEQASGLPGKLGGSARDGCLIWIPRLQRRNPLGRMWVYARIDRLKMWVPVNSQLRYVKALDVEVRQNLIKGAQYPK